jgi:membrane-anchored protein YejM (alkaline phosphatase superfamily)
MALLDAGPQDRNAGQRFPALVWSLLHVPLFLALFWPGIEAAVRATPEPFRPWLWPTFLPQATLIALVGWVVSWPFSLVPRTYRFAAPAMIALVSFVVAVDAQVYGSVGFHLNGFFFRVMLQANALKEAGVPIRSVVLFAAAGAVFFLLDVWLGSRFIRRFPTPRRAWILALALALASTAERIYGALLVHWGGPSIFAASTVIPLQPPVRMGTIARRVFGDRGVDPFQGSAASKRLPAGIAAEAIRLTRRPDVLFIATESLPANHLDPKNMPNLWRRSEQGARFEHHYSGASSTNYTLFTLMYGLQAQKLESIIGAGRRPILFPALAANGYRVQILAASCVDWMDLKDTVFGGVPPKDLHTWCDNAVEPPDRDAAMIRDALSFAEREDPDRPMFLFMFFFGTHFNYFHDAEDALYLPEWDGADVLKATATSGDKIDNRSRNAAHKVDRLIEGFLERFQQARGGREPLVVFTGDHGEEFRQKGHIGHGSAVTSEQIHVPAIWFGPGVPKGVYDKATSHSDVVPTLLALLGDTHPPSLYADGMSMFTAPDDRFVCSTVGWEPHYAVIGKDLKVVMYAGLGTASITDPEDRPIPDGPLRMAKAAGRIMRALRGESGDAPAAAEPVPAKVEAPAPKLAPIRADAPSPQ